MFKRLNGETISILGLPYKISVISGYFEKSKCLGEIRHYQDAEIILDSNLTNDCGLSTFVHEVLEGILRLQEIKLRHDNISRIETGFYQVLKNNPKIWRIVMESMYDLKKAEPKKRKKKSKTNKPSAGRRKPRNAGKGGRKNR